MPAGTTKVLMEKPPQQLMVWPVMKEAAGDARNTARPAISLAKPRRPIGVALSKVARISGRTIFLNRGESIVPGMRTFTLILSTAHSNANWRLMVIRAPLVAL